MSYVIKFGEIGDRFYIILKGACSVLIPNSSIVNRDDKLKELQKLKEWKEQEFDKRVSSAKTKFLQNYMLGKLDHLKLVKDENDPEAKTGCE